MSGTLFNTSQANAKVMAMLGPAVDDENGYEVDVASG